MRVTAFWMVSSKSTKTEKKQNLNCTACFSDDGLYFLRNPGSPFLPESICDWDFGKLRDFQSYNSVMTTGGNYSNLYCPTSRPAPVRFFMVRYYLRRQQNGCLTC